MPHNREVAKAVYRLLSDAIESGASDVIIEPNLPGLKVRFRLDGVLVRPQRVPVEFVTHPAEIIGRVKVLARMNDAERGLPQEGRFTVKSDTSHREFEIRVATVPVANGEGIVMRLILTNASHSPQPSRN